MSVQFINAGFSCLVSLFKSVWLHCKTVQTASSARSLLNILCILFGFNIIFHGVLMIQKRPNVRVWKGDGHFSPARLVVSERGNYRGGIQSPLALTLLVTYYEAKGYSSEYYYPLQQGKMFLDFQLLQYPGS